LKSDTRLSFSFKSSAESNETEGDRNLFKNDVGIWNSRPCYTILNVKYISDQQIRILRLINLWAEDKFPIVILSSMKICFHHYCILSILVRNFLWRRGQKSFPLPFVSFSFLQIVLIASISLLNLFNLMYFFGLSTLSIFI